MNLFSAVWTRTLLVAGISLVLPMVALLAGLVYLSDIHRETRSIAFEDVPATKAITEITVAQLNQEIRLERAVSLGLRFYAMPEFEAEFKANANAFAAQSEKIAALYTETIADLATKSRETDLASVSKKFDSLIEKLGEAERTKHEYSRLGLLLLEKIRNGDREERPALTLKIVDLEERLADLLVRALRDVELFTEKSALKTEKLERDAVFWVSALAIIAVVVAAIASGMIGLSISQPIVQAAADIQRLSRGNTEPVGEKKLGGLREAETLYDGIEGFRRSILRERTAAADLEQKAGELKTALEGQQQVNKMQKDFLAMTTHEFRTPLAIIDGAAQRIFGVLGTNRYDETETARRLTSIRNNVERMTRLIDATLDAAKLDEEKLVPEIKPFSITSIAVDIQRRHNELAGWSRILFEADGPERPVNADQRLIDRVIDNIVANATRYTAPEQPVFLHVQFGDENVSVSVADKGTDVAEADIDRLFDKFTRGKNSGGTAGTGLGLYICKRFIELHDGEILAERLPEDSGTRFKFTIPIDAA